MKLEIHADADAVAKHAAQQIAAEARAAIAARGKFVLAVSGGTTPWQMLRHLAHENLPWKSIHIVQVDERIAPVGSEERNLTHLCASLAVQPTAAAPHIYPMPVNADDLTAAAHEYGLELNTLTGFPTEIDIVHLGLGADGHTASLVPNDPVLEVHDKDVAITGLYQGCQRMTLTYPVLNRARRVLWLVTGDSKQEMLARLCAGDTSIPSGKINRAHAIILADQAAAGSLEAGLISG